MVDNTSIRAYYEQQPYPDSVFHFTHPAHIGAFAKLYGHPAPADPATARILDVGCGQGANLIKIAADLPGADCIGLDLAGVHIQQATQQARSSGLSNIRFDRADILEHDFSGQQFDYIIAHGFFAWVPDEVRERLLSICRDHLSPQGLAVISYNCLPGWSMRSGLRLLMQMENELEGNTGRELLRGAERVADFFKKTIPAVAKLPHSPLLKAEIDNLTGKDADIVLHDELEPLNDPQYLLQFAQWAQAYDLSYVCDTNLLNDWLEIYPVEVKRALAETKMSRMQALQYTDFLINRDFRRSVICPASAAEQINANPASQNLRGLWVASRLRVEPVINHQDGKTYRFVATDSDTSRANPEIQPPDDVLRVSESLLQAFLDHLAKTPGQFQPIELILTESCRQLGLDTSNEACERLALSILNLTAQGYLKVSLGGNNPQ